MATYILKVYEVEAEGNGTWQPEYTKETFRSQSSAESAADYWGNEHGMSVTTWESYIECPVIDGTVFVPETVL